MKYLMKYQPVGLFLVEGLRMNLNMTNSTDRYNFKMSGIVWMMIFSCLFTAFAFKGIDTWQFVLPDNIVDRITSLSFFNIFFGISSLDGLAFIGLFVPLLTGLASIALRISFLAGFIFKGLVIGFNAYFTLNVIPVFYSPVLIKLRSFFDLLASTAAFCYDWFEHVLFLFKRICSGPLQDRFLSGFFIL